MTAHHCGLPPQTRHEKIRQIPPGGSLQNIYLTSLPPNRQVLQKQGKPVKCGNKWSQRRCGHLGEIPGGKTTIGGKLKSRFLSRSKVLIIHQHLFFNCDNCTIPCKMFIIRKIVFGVYGNTLYYLYSFPVNPRVF